MTVRKHLLLQALEELILDSNDLVQFMQWHRGWNEAVFFHCFSILRVNCAVIDRRCLVAAYMDCQMSSLCMFDIILCAVR